MPTNKPCTKCGEEKPIDRFKVKKGKVTSHCRLCYSRYYSGRKWKGGVKVRGPVLSDTERKAKHKMYRKAYKVAMKKRAQTFLKELLVRSVCMDCGYSNWIALEFDHREPEKKHKDVTEMVSRGYSLDSLKSEIAKCDIVCSNCHTIRTAKQFGSWRLLC